MSFNIYVLFLFISISLAFDSKKQSPLSQLNQYFKSLNSRFHETQFQTTLGNFLFSSNQSQIINSILNQFNQTIDETNLKSYLVSLSEQCQELGKISTTTLSQLSFNIMNFFDNNKNGQIEKEELGQLMNQWMTQITYHYPVACKIQSDKLQKSGLLKDEKYKMNAFYSILRCQVGLYENEKEAQQLTLTKCINMSNHTRHIKQCLDTHLDPEVKLLCSTFTEKDDDGKLALTWRTIQILSNRFERSIRFFLVTGLALMNYQIRGEFFIQFNWLSKSLRSFDMFKAHLPLLGDNTFKITLLELLYMPWVHLYLFFGIPIASQVPFLKDSLPQLDQSTLDLNEYCGVFQTTLASAKNNVRPKDLNREWSIKHPLKGFETSILKACSTNISNGNISNLGFAYSQKRRILLPLASPRIHCVIIRNEGCSKIYSNNVTSRNNTENYFYPPIMTLPQSTEGKEVLLLGKYSNEKSCRTQCDIRPLCQAFEIRVPIITNMKVKSPSNLQSLECRLKLGNISLRKEEPSKYIAFGAYKIK